MKNILVLTKSLLINSFSINSLKPRNFKKKNLWIVLLLILISPSFYFMYQGFCKMAFFFAEQFHSIGQHGYLIGMAYNAISLIVLLFGLIQVSSIFYYSNDIESLLVLPVKSKQVVIAKFFIIYIQELIFAVLILTPIFISVGLVTDAGMIYYLFTSMAILLSPVVPLAISTMVMMVVMSLTSLSKKKDLFRVVSMFLVLALYLGFNFYLTSAINQGTMGEADFILKLITDNQSMLQTLSYSNPLAKWLGVSILGADNSVLSGVLYIAGNVLIYAAVIVFAEKLYIGGIINGRDVSSTKKEMSDADYDKSISKSSSPYMAFAKADLITIIKTPVFLLNCVSTIVLIPLIYGMMFFVGDSSMSNLLEFIPYDNPGLLVLMIAAGTMFMTVINPTASTTFSRMGKNLWVARIAPLSPFEHMISRLIIPMLFTAISGLIMAGIAFVMLEVSVVTALLGFLVGVIASTPLLIAGLIIDTLRPLLEWDNPQRAVKNNLNVIAAMLIGTALAAGSGFLIIKVFSDFDMQLVTIAFVAAYGVLAFILSKVSQTLIKDKFATME